MTLVLSYPLYYAMKLVFILDKCYSFTMSERNDVLTMSYHVPLLLFHRVLSWLEVIYTKDGI